MMTIIYLINPSTNKLFNEVYNDKVISISGKTYRQTLNRLFPYCYQSHSLK